MAAKKTATFTPEIEVEVPKMRLEFDGSNSTKTESSTQTASAAAQPQQPLYIAPPAPQPVAQEKSTPWGWIVAGILGTIVLAALLFVGLPAMIMASADSVYSDRNSQAYKANEQVNKKIDNLPTKAELGTVVGEASKAVIDEIKAHDQAEAARHQQQLDAVSAFRKAIGGDVRGVRRKVEANGAKIGAIKASTDRTAKDLETSLDALRRELARDSRVVLEERR